MTDERTDWEKRLDGDLQDILPDEIRTTNPYTGAQKGVKPERYDLIPVVPLKELAKLYGFGAGKYAERNWEKGIDFSKHYAAMQRHANQWWGGEDLDEESQLSHMASVAWHALALIEGLRRHPELDDRPTSVEKRLQDGGLR